MTIAQHMRIGNRLISGALRTAWRSKQLWWYGVGLIVVLAATFAAWLGIARLLGYADTSWRLLLDPSYYVTFSLPIAAIKNIIFLAGYVVAALVTAALMRALFAMRNLSTAPLSAWYWFMLGFWGVIQGVVWLSTSYAVARVSYLPLAFAIKLIISTISFSWVFVLPLLIASPRSPIKAIWQSMLGVLGHLGLVLWAFFLFMAVFVLIGVGVVAFAILLAKMIGMVFSLSPITALVPFALIGGTFVALFCLYLFVAWCALTVDLYAHCRIE